MLELAKSDRNLFIQRDSLEQAPLLKTQELAGRMMIQET